MIVYTDEQGSEGWLEARRGVITASRFKDCRERLKNGDLSAKAKLYAMDVARERVGGMAAGVFQNAAMRFGTEQEPIARAAYEALTGNLCDTAGFIATDDRKFGVSVDAMIDDDGVWECKCLVSSDMVFTVLVDGDISSFVDQCNGAMWLLDRKWVDLTLWTPDLPHKITVIRIDRDDDQIEALEADLMAFERLVTKYEQALRATIGKPKDDSPPWADQPPATPTKTHNASVHREPR